MFRDDQLQGYLRHLEHLVGRDDVPRIFRPADIYRHSRWSLDGTQTNVVLDYGLSIGRLRSRKLRTKGRPSVVYYFPGPNHAAPSAKELAGLDIDPGGGNARPGTLFGDAIPSVAEGDEPPAACGVCGSAHWWRLRVTIHDRWGRWHCASCHEQPHGWGGPLETRGPQFDERVPDSAMSRRQYEQGVLAQQNQRERFDGQGKPRFWPSDCCPHHPHGQHEFLKSGNSNQRWRCIQCYGPFSDSILMEMGRWVVQPDEPGKIEYVGAGRGQPSMASAFGGKTHQEI